MLTPNVVKLLSAFDQLCGKLLAETNPRGQEAVQVGLDALRAVCAEWPKLPPELSELRVMLREALPRIVNTYLRQRLERYFVNSVREERLLTCTVFIMESLLRVTPLTCRALKVRAGVTKYSVNPPPISDVLALLRQAGIVSRVQAVSAGQVSVGSKVNSPYALTNEGHRLASQVFPKS